VISRWLKNVGDAVLVDEPVVTLETDKVTVDVPSPASGALSATAHREGGTVKVGEALGEVDADAKVQAPAPPPTPPEKKDETPAELLESGAYKLIPEAADDSARAVPITPVARKMVEERGMDTSQIQGSGPGGKITKEDVMGAQA